jgi:hypothetical protein
VLVLLVVGLVGLGAAVGLVWVLSGVSGSATVSGERVTAEVLTSTSCGAPDAHDTVRFTAGGETREARLDGCGHAEGETFEVIVPAGATTVMVAGAVPEGVPLATRLNALLLVLSAVAGGGYAFLVRRPVVSARRTPASPAAG